MRVGVTVRHDIILFVAALFLTSLGFSSLYSIGAGRTDEAFQFLSRQLIFFAVLVPIAVATSFVHYNFFRSTSALIYLVSIASLILVLFFGDVVRGTRGWFSLSGMTFQPVEIAKISLVLVLALYFSRHTKQVHQFRHILVSGAIAALPIVFVLLQPDIGSASILFFVWIAMILVSRISKKTIASLLLLLAIALVGAWFFLLQDYQKNRIRTFVNPASDMQGRGYNVRQAMIAIGSGQIFGKGLGSGSQSQLRFLPEAQTDFIFSVVGEELGLFGIFLILGAWAVFLSRLFILMRRSHDDFAQYTLYGLAILFFAHITINIGGNMGLLPVTGIVLPFMSYGGSALAMSYISVGIIESIAYYSPPSSSSLKIDTFLG